MNHHPALAATGEIEIAQRHALAEAYRVANRHAAVGDGVSVEQTRLAIDAYLATMRAHYVPGPIVIGEGDHIVVEMGGLFAKIGAERNGSGDWRISIDDGDEIHYPYRSAPPS